MTHGWYRLDNAALIFPAIMKKDWNNSFRLSATLKDRIDPEILAKAASDIKNRFPTFFVRLKTGFFWYYLEEIKDDVVPQKDFAYPLTYMSRSELRRCCIRILYHDNRIAVEFFHAVTDGNGGCIFLKNLVARYIELADGIDVPKVGDIHDLSVKPSDEEIEDGFLANAASHSIGRNEGKSYHPRGTYEEDDFRNIVIGIVETDRLIEKAHEYGVTVTAYLSALMLDALIKNQNDNKKTVQISIPVNLRKLYNFNTYRNFSLPVYVGVDPRIGEYSIEELCKIVSHQIAADAIPQKMAGRIAANVRPQQNILIRLAPLPIKNMVMRMVYKATGERFGALNISNLGNQVLPDEMMFVERMEFIIGVQYTYPNNCSVISCNGKTCISMIRSIKESDIEKMFFSKLVEEGIPTLIESNKDSKRN